MFLLIYRFTLLVFCAALAGCAFALKSNTHVEERVRAALRQLDGVQNAGDLAGFGALMPERMVFMPPESPPVIGKTEVLRFYRGFFAQFIMSIDHHPSETRICGDIMVHHGRATGSLTPRAGGAAIRFDNKYLYILRSLPDGRLLWEYAMFNTNLPSR